jgi:hypothetical protein
MNKLWPFALLLAGCIIAPTSGGDDIGDDDPQAAVDAWNAKVAELDARRSAFLGKQVQDLAPAGSTLYWYDTTNFDFKLMRWDGQAKLGYTFSIGRGDDHNYRASQHIVVTADGSSQDVAYRAYSASSPNQLIDQVTLPKSVGAKWHAYAVDSQSVYIMHDTALKKWQPGSGTLTTVTTLASAGVQAGEFWDFGVAGNTMVFIESGRVWSMDLAANRATWLMNMTEAAGHVDFRPDGVLFDTATGLSFYDYAQSKLVDIKAKIDANPLKLSDVYTTAAKFDTDFTRYKQHAIYIGNMGVFAYDIKADKITPLLLSPVRADLRIDYRYPVALDNGLLFVTGLTSTSGATGADGPTYQVDLKPILN